MADTVAIRNTTRSAPPRLPFEEIKNKVLGTRYQLSLVFVGDARGRALNQKYRKKQTVPNVLAFPLSQSEGEIFISPNRARKEAAQFGMSVRAHIAFLYIHGLLHLKGLAHGSTMERKEQQLLRTFDIV
jgi:probable rRNA maturation factor